MYGTNNAFPKKMKFYDVRLKNFLVLFARRGRGLNHSGGNSEGKPSLGEGGGYSVFQVIGTIEWDRRALLTTNLQIVLNTQTKTNPYLSQATQKTPANDNFQHPKILRTSPSLEIRSTPPPLLPGSK